MRGQILRSLMRGLGVHYLVLYAAAGRLPVYLELADCGLVLVVGLGAGVGALLAEGELLQVCASIAGVRRVVETWGLDVFVG